MEKQEHYNSDQIEFHPENSANSMVDVKEEAYDDSLYDEAEIEYSEQDSTLHMQDIPGVGADDSNSTEFSFTSETMVLQYNQFQPDGRKFAPKLYKCTIPGCSKTFTRPGNARAHLQTHTGEKPYHCDICLKTFSHKKSLGVHKRGHNNEKSSYKCGYPDCNEIFPTYHLFVGHKKVHTGETPYKCNVCARSFNSNSNLISHVRTHTGEKPYKCAFIGCKAAFGQLSHLTEHNRIHTGEKLFECPYCSKSFISNSSRTKHMRTHTSDKPFKCNYENCNTAFATAVLLIQHNRIHTGELLHQCQLCFKTFNNKSNLNRHILTHTGVKPHKCDYGSCTAAFPTAGRLKAHRLTHDGLKSFRCDYCLKAFSAKLSLTIHIRTHTGERPYKCTAADCDEAFYSAVQLGIHNAKHTGEDQFKCIFCLKPFRCRSNLSKHMRVHADEITYKCDYLMCEAVFFQKADLKNHKETHHNVS